MILNSQTAAEASLPILSESEQSVVDRMNALGTPLGDWNIEIDRIARAIHADAPTSRYDESSLLKYLRAVMNSSLIRWFLQHSHSPTEKINLESAPIPKIPPSEQRPFIKLVDQILEAKSADPEADTSYFEWDIDDLVYDLYGLSEEEKTEVERSLGLIHQTDEEEDAATIKWIQEGTAGEYVSEDVIMETLRNPNGN